MGLSHVLRDSLRGQPGLGQMVAMKSPKEIAVEIHYATEHVQGCSPGCVVEIAIIEQALVAYARACFEEAIALCKTVQSDSLLEPGGDAVVAQAKAQGATACVRAITHLKELLGE